MAYLLRRSSGCTVLLARVILMLLIFSGESFTFSLGSSLKSGTNSVVSLKPIATKVSSLRAKPLVDDLSHDVPSKIQKEFPRPKGIYDRLMFDWVKDLMVKGNQKPLELDDIWMLEENKRMKSSSEAFERLFEIEKVKSSRQPSSPSQASEDAKMNILLQFWKSPITRAIVRL